MVQLGEDGSMISTTKKVKGDIVVPVGIFLHLWLHFLFFFVFCIFLYILYFSLYFVFFFVFCICFGFPWSLNLLLLGGERRHSSSRWNDIRGWSSGDGQHPDQGICLKTCFAHSDITRRMGLRLCPRTDMSKWRRSRVTRKRSSLSAAGPNIN